MKYFNLLIVIILVQKSLSAQNIHFSPSKNDGKSIINDSAILSWEYIGNDPLLSNNAQYFVYSYTKGVTGKHTTIVEKTDSSWKLNLLDANNVQFSEDCKNLFFMRKDTLYFLDLDSKVIHIEPNVQSFSIPASGMRSWLGFKLKNGSKEMVLLNIKTNARKTFSNVEDFRFNNNGTSLIFKSISNDDSVKINSLYWVSIPDIKVNKVYESKDEILTNSFTFSQEGKQLLFTVKGLQTDIPTYSIWYYSTDEKRSAIKKVYNEMKGLNEDWKITPIAAYFSENGKYILFNVLKSTKATSIPGKGVDVDIWNYKEPILQSTQLLTPQRLFTAVIKAANDTAFLLESDNEELVPTGNRNFVTGDWVLIKKNFEVNDLWWTLSPQPAYFLVSLKSKEKYLISKSAGNSYLAYFSFSPNGKYLTFWDSRESNYYSYEIKNRELRNITRSIPTKVKQVDEFEKNNNSVSVPVAAIAGWDKRDLSILIYDNYDIWQVDPSASKKPINLTNGFGRSHNIKLRLIDGPKGISDQTYALYEHSDSLLLSGFNVVNKENGFFLLRLGSKVTIKQLVMAPYTFYRVNSQKPYHTSFDDGMKPIKALDSNIWVIKRQSAVEAPNYFLTNDFSKFQQLTNLQPQSNYNWITAELVSWKRNDGIENQGILYKPENFDPHKKYPVIFNYYRQVSHRLYEYPYPKYTAGNVNIPWFVSRGYLVMTPDIFFTKDSIGESACHSIVSAAEHMAHQPWVDSSRMAINGHSFGGYETNYILTHTHLFKAAVAAAGTSDWISSYNGLAGALFGETSRQTLYEENSINGTLWDKPELYIQNSPIINADNVCTPLLIMHNKKDNLVPWTQSVEFFLALRRLGKKVWMLQYDDGIHVVWGKDAVDFTIRVTQFFDHYLKGAPPPVWMTKGIPAKMKGIETGYELDTSGSIP